VTVALKLEWEIGSNGKSHTIHSLAAAVERAGAKLEQVGEFIFPRLIPALEAAEKRQFSAEGAGPVAGKWAALSPQYAAWKQQHYPGKPILEREGVLKQALTGSGGNSLREYTHEAMNFGTIGVPYASFHQLGTGRMAARPPLDFDEKFQADMVKALQLGVVDAFRAADAADLLESE